MNGYKRVKTVGTERSRSIDFSDLSFKSKTPRPTSNQSSSNPPASNVCPDKKIPEKIPAPVLQGNQNEDEDGVGEIFGVILNRKCSSVSSTSSHNYSVSDQKENASIQRAVKRVLSMKRSASVSEGYCRIHHQCDPTDADDDEENVGLNSLRRRSAKKKGKFFRAFQRIFGF